MKSLIIGSSGFLGSSLLKRFLSEGKEVHIMNRSKDPSFDGTQYDINCIHETSNIFDNVFFLAAYIPSSSNLKQDMNVNIQLSESVFHQFNESKIIYSSSVSIYGEQPIQPIVETMFPNYPSHYGLSKLYGEALFSQLATYVNIRFSSLYGPGMKGTTFIKRIIEDALKTGTIHLYSPDRLQDYLYIDDAVDILVEASIGDITGTFNGVNGLSWTNQEIVNIVSSLISNTKVIKYDGNDDPYWYSRSLLDQNFPTLKRTLIRTGLSNTVKYFIHHI